MNDSHRHMDDRSNLCTWQHKEVGGFQDRIRAFPPTWNGLNAPFVALQREWEPRHAFQSILYDLLPSNIYFPLGYKEFLFPIPSRTAHLSYHCSSLQWLNSNF